MQNSLQQVTDLLTKDQIARQHEILRFRRNLHGIRSALGLEVEAIMVCFSVSDTEYLAPSENIGYYSKGLQHCTLEKRQALELAELRYDSPAGIAKKPALVAIAMMCKDANFNEYGKNEDGRGLLYLNLRAEEWKIRFTPSAVANEDEINYPYFLLL